MPFCFLTMELHPPFVMFTPPCICLERGSLYTDVTGMSNCTSWPPWYSLVSFDKAFVILSIHFHAKIE